jgi:GcrA cell cycle regulator
MRVDLWTAEADARLRALWAEGLSAAAIGALIAKSKNAVLGRVHRLNLPGRASPTKPRGELRPGRKGVPKRRARLPGVSVPQGIAALAGGTLEALGLVPAGLPKLVDVAPVRLDSRHCCTWPIGEPRTKEFRYCDAPALAGKSYCPAHDELAVVRVVRARTPAELAADEARRVAAHGRMASGGGTALAVGTDWFAPSWAR